MSLDATGPCLRWGHGCSGCGVVCAMFCPLCFSQVLFQLLLTFKICMSPGCDSLVVYVWDRGAAEQPVWALSWQQHSLLPCPSPHGGNLAPERGAGCAPHAAPWVPASQHMLGSPRQPSVSARSGPGARPQVGSVSCCSVALGQGLLPHSGPQFPLSESLVAHRDPGLSGKAVSTSSSCSHLSL